MYMYSMDGYALYMLEPMRFYRGCPGLQWLYELRLNRADIVIAKFSKVHYGN